MGLTSCPGHVSHYSVVTTVSRPLQSKKSPSAYLGSTVVQNKVEPFSDQGLYWKSRSHTTTSHALPQNNSEDGHLNSDHCQISSTHKCNPNNKLVSSEI